MLMINLMLLIHDTNTYQFLMPGNVNEAEEAREISRLTIQLFTDAKNFLNIASHDLMHLIEFIVKFCNVPLGSGIQIQFPGFLYERV